MAWVHPDVPRLIFIVRVVVWMGCGLFAWRSPYDVWVWLGAFIVLGGGLALGQAQDFRRANRAAILWDILGISIAVHVSGHMANNAFIFYGGEAIGLTAAGSLQWSVVGTVVSMVAYALAVGPREALTGAFGFRVFALTIIMLTAGSLGQLFVAQQQHGRLTRRRLMELESLKIIQEGLLKEEPLEILLANLLGQALALLGVDAGFVGLRDADGRMHMVASVGLSDRIRLSTWDPTTDEPSATAVRQGSLVIVNNLEQLEQMGATSLQQEGLTSLAIVPLYESSELLGVLCVGSRGAGPLWEAHQFVIETLSNLVLGQIRFNRERAAARKRRRLLSTLDRLGKILGSNLQMSAVLAALHQAVAEELPLDKFFVALTISGDKARVYMAYHSEEGRLYDPGVVELVPESPMARAIESAEPRLYQGQWEDSNRLESDHLPTGMILVPLKHETRVIGVICAQSYREPYGQDHLEFLSALASQAAIAIQNAQLYQHSQEVATTDHLTGLGNARQFSMLLQQYVQLANQQARKLSLLLIDSDSLKEINDRYGHAAGDAHLIHVAQMIRQNVRGGDMACRYAGDEFVVLLPDSDIASAKKVGERIRNAVAAGFQWSQDQWLFTSVSIGAAEYEPGMLAEALFAHADHAMYQAKQLGKNQVVPAPTEPY